MKELDRYRALRVFPAALALCLVVVVPWPSAAQGGEVAGHVVDLSSAQPIASATVTLSAASGMTRQLASDANGLFVFRDLSPGRYTVRAEAEGYVPRLGARRGGFTAAALNSGLDLVSGRLGHMLISRLERQPEPFYIAVSADRPESQIEIALARGGTIAGNVRARSDGAPIGGAVVTLSRRVVADGRGRLVPFAKTVTGDDGYYQASSLVPGEYFVGVDDLSHRVTYFPNSESAEVATSIRVDVGAEVDRIDVYIDDDVSSVAISGTVGTPPGEPAPRVYYLVREDFGASGLVEPRMYVSREIGGEDYRIDGVSPGFYRIFSPPQLDSTRLSLEFESGYYASAGVIRVDSDSLEDVHLDFFPGGRVAGSVDADQPTISLLDTVRIVLDPVGPFGRMLDYGQLTTARFIGRVTPAGEVRFPDLPQGVFALSIQGLPNDVYVDSVRLDGRSVLDMMSIEIRSKNHRLDMTLRPDAGTVQGVAHDRWLESVAGARVVLTRRGRPPYLATADGQGRFVLDRLPPGEYRIAALPSDADIPGAIPVPGADTIIVRSGLNADVRVAVRNR